MSEARSPWVAIAVDVGAAGLLLLLGLDPVADLVSAHTHEAAYVLGGLHIVLIPWAFLTALLRANELAVFGDGQASRLSSVFEYSLLLLLITGWMLPLFAFSVVPSVSKYLFYGCIGAHVAPIFLIVLAALVGQGERLDRLVADLVRRTWLMGLLVGAYMAVAEVFLVKMRLHSARVAPMAFVSWLLAYLPIRLFLARLTGSRGPEWGSLLASMLWLLLRLLSLRP